MGLKDKIRKTDDIMWEWCGVIPYMGRVEVKVFSPLGDLSLPWLATALFFPQGEPAWVCRGPVAISCPHTHTLEEVCRDFEEELLRRIPEIRGPLEAPDGCM